jgi:periplasmic divalent cation tolerance protein
MQLSDDDPVLILCTAPSPEVGGLLAKGLVEARLAACVNLLHDIRSCYVWNGELEQTDEVQLLIKTRRARYAEVERWLLAHHPYEVPEVLALPVERASERYLAWIREQTS